MKILVLGGNGYLGNKVTRELLKDKKRYSVICAQRTGSSNKRLDDLNGEIRIIPSTIEAIEMAFQYEKIDVVLNTICNYQRYDLLYESIINANTVFPLNVLNLAAAYNVKRFITIGTSLPPDLNIYSFSKNILDMFGKFYVDKCGISYTDIILEMFYGADEPKDRFIPGTIRKMLKGEDVDTTVGTQKRDIIAISDVVKAIMTVLEEKLDGYNEISVGTGDSPTISEVLDFIWQQTGCVSRVNKGVVPMRKNEPDCVADLTKIRSLCDWNPTDWKTGLSDMIENIKTRCFNDEDSD